jgi:hypothetical protein
LLIYLSFNHIITGQGEGEKKNLDQHQDNLDANFLLMPRLVYRIKTIKFQVDLQFGLINLDDKMA